MPYSATQAELYRMAAKAACRRDWTMAQVEEAIEEIRRLFHAAGYVHISDNE